MATRYAGPQRRRRARLRDAGLCIQCGRAPIYRAGLCARHYTDALARKRDGPARPGPGRPPIED